MVPGLGGLDICRQVRPQFANPILMLTARTDDFDHVIGLELGADDYVKKPVVPRVLLARWYGWLSVSLLAAARQSLA